MTEQPGQAAAERARLCDLLEEVGPDAPTLCEGWRTQELAAHLVTREGRPDALLGIIVPPLHRWTAKLEDATKQRHGYGELVQTLRGGPPFGRSVLGLPGLRERLNLHEFFVHHEDVRRAQPGWSPRPEDKELNDALWARLSLTAPLLFRKLHDTSVCLQSMDGRTRAVGKGEEVVVSGPVPELFLFAYGRRTAADVRISGSVAGMARLAATTLSI